MTFSTNYAIFMSIQMKGGSMKQKMLSTTWAIIHGIRPVIKRVRGGFQVVLETKHIPEAAICAQELPPSTAFLPFWQSYTDDGFTSIVWIVLRHNDAICPTFLRDSLKISHCIIA